MREREREGGGGGGGGGGGETEREIGSVEGDDNNEDDNNEDNNKMKSTKVQTLGTIIFWTEMYIYSNVWIENIFACIG